MASIAIVPHGYGVCTGWVLGSPNRVLADLVGKLGPGGRVPDLSAGMVEAHASDREVGDYIIRVDDTVEGSFGEKSHYMISECLVASSWRPEVIQLEVSRWIKSFLDIDCSEGGKSCSKRVTSDKD